VAAAVGGFAPDIDVTFAWMTLLGDSWYPMTHRGVSHTLIGAPLFALAIFYLISRAPLKRRWDWPKELVFDRGTLIMLLLGAWSHLVLDGLTITGTPAFWPFSTVRVSVWFYFWSVPAMMIVSIVIWVKLIRRTASPRARKIGLGLIVAAMALTGALRGITYPYDLPEGSHVTPTFADWAWIVSVPNATGVTVYESGWGADTAIHHFPEANRTQAADAIARCQSLDGYVKWRWNVLGLPVINATREEPDAWVIRFEDSTVLYSSASGDLDNSFRKRFFDEDRFRFHCRATDDGIAIHT
jgi:membrane-bound metal-dependent hydrolase YbcI (DUF457 family)